MCMIYSHALCICTVGNRKFASDATSADVCVNQHSTALYLLLNYWLHSV